jgi:hypothetical protein
LAGDERRTVLDVYPRGREHVPAAGEYAVRTNPAPSPHSEVHLALHTVLAEQSVLAIASREAWFAQRSDRGGLFAVVEFWVENKFLLELLPDSEQRRYVENVSASNLKALFSRSAQ